MTRLSCFSPSNFVLETLWGLVQGLKAGWCSGGILSHSSCSISHELPCNFMTLKLSGYLHASGDSWIAGFHGTTGQLAGKPGTCAFPSVTSLSLKTTRCVTVGWKVSERLHATLWENTWKETRCCWSNGNLYHSQNIYFPRSGNTRACLYRVFSLLLLFSFCYW